MGKQKPPNPIPAFKKLAPILLSEPIPFATSSILAPVFSHTLATALMKDIFVAKKELDACFISSALFTSVMITCECFIIGLYIFLNKNSACLLGTPATTLSGFKKSLTAEPSLRNSGFDVTSNGMCFLLNLVIVFSIRWQVSTGTVDFSMITV